MIEVTHEKQNNENNIIPLIYQYYLKTLLHLRKKKV